MTQIDAALLAAMLQESMQQGERPSLTITSNSMYPLFQQGDQVIIEAVQIENLRPGDIITLLDAQDASQLLTHRYWGTVQHKQHRTLITRGDRPLWFDPPHTETDLIGRVVGRHRNGKKLSLTTGAGRWLNHWLSRQAILESRWFTKQTIGSTKEMHGDLEASNRRARRQQRQLTVRILRRLLLWFEVGVTAVVGHVAINTA